MRRRNVSFVTYAAVPLCEDVTITCLEKFGDCWIRCKDYILKLVHTPIKTPAADNVFNNKVVHNSNMLPENVVSAITVNTFKKKFDTWLRKSESVVKSKLNLKQRILISRASDVDMSATSACL